MSLIEMYQNLLNEIFDVLLYYPAAMSLVVFVYVDEHVLLSTKT
jgi:hypothetical protein